MRSETMRKRFLNVAAGILSMVFLLIIAPPITASAEGNAGLGYEEADGNWYYYVDGVVDHNYSGLVEDENGWWLVRNGMVDFGYTGLWEDPQYGWWLIGGGQIAFEYTGLWNDPVCGWWLVKEGEVAFDHTGLWYDQNCGWWLVSGGRVAFEHTGFWDDPVYGAWLVNGGTVAFDYTGLWNDPYYGWWLVGNGKVAFEYTGLWNDPNCGWWLVDEGAVAFGYTGLWNDPNCGWWLIDGGTVAFGYTGPWNDAVYGNWMITGGTVTGPVAGVTDRYPDAYGNAEGYAGDIMHTYFFDYTVNSAYLCNEYEGYTPQAGNEILVANVTVKNNTAYEITMFDTDFQVQWSDQADYAYEFPITYKGIDVLNDQMLPEMYDLSAGETVSGLLVYEVPAGERAFSISYQEIFDDDSRGAVCFVYLTADRK